MSDPGDEDYKNGNTDVSDSLSQSGSEASPRAENDGIESPGHTPESTINGPTQKKRKDNDSTSKQNQISINRRYRINRKYRKLYNSYVEEVNSLTIVGGYGQQLTASQIGISLWSVEEKELFFHVLARKGRHDIKGIATEIGSKSETEIAQYIELLSKGLADTELSVRRQRFVDRPLYDAAYELSADCTTLLDRAAQDLQKKVDKEEAKEQQSKLWLLRPKISERIEKYLRNPEVKDEEISHILPAATFLNLKQFLHLSKRFFMNSSDLEHNWYSYTRLNYTPNETMITCSAFSDFHSLAVSITKRLMHSTLYFTMSRLRVMEASLHPSRLRVRTEDVLAAVEVLGMPKNSRSFWAGVARRQKLRVFEMVRHQKAAGRRYNYDQIEKLLSVPSKKRKIDHTPIQGDDEYMDEGDDHSSDSQSGSSLNSNDNDDNHDDDDEEEDNQEDNEEENADPDETDDSNSSTRSSPSTPQAADSPPPSSSSSSDDEPPDKAEAEALARDFIQETLDQKRSRKEEARLWKLLGEEIPGSRSMDVSSVDEDSDEDDDDDDDGDEAEEVGEQKGKGKGKGKGRGGGTGKGRGRGEKQMKPAPRKTRLELVDWTSWTDFAAEWETLERPVKEEAFRGNRMFGKGRGKGKEKERISVGDGRVDGKDGVRLSD